MAKYEIKIRISSEEVFRMLARYAPWELVDVEELPPNPLPKAPPSVKALANHLKRISSVKFDSVAQVRKMRTGKGVDLRRGMALAVMTALRDGQEHTTAELIKSLEKHGFKAASINSLVVRMTKFEHIRRTKPGFWIKANARHGVDNKGRQEDSDPTDGEKTPA